MVLAYVSQPGKYPFTSLSEAAELSESEAPRPTPHAVSVGGDAGAKVFPAEVLGVEERHDPCTL